MRKNSSLKPGKSHLRLRDAALRLLDERVPEEVTITDIVSEAGLTRPTFYAVFPDLASSFEDAAMSRLEAVFEGVALAGDLPPTQQAQAMETAFLTVIRRIALNEVFFARVLRSSGGRQIHHRLVQFLAERLRARSPLSAGLAGGPVPAEVSSEALAAGVIWTVTAWLEAEKRRPAEELATQIRDLLFHAVVGGLSQTHTTDRRKES